MFNILLIMKGAMKPLPNTGVLLLVIIRPHTFIPHKTFKTITRRHARDVYTGRGWQDEGTRDIGRISLLSFHVTPGKKSICFRIHFIFQKALMTKCQSRLIYSFSMYVLNTYCVLTTVPGPGHRIVSTRQVRRQKVVFLILT